MDMRLEVVVLPVDDVDRAKAFYTERLGFRLDADFPVDDGYRVVQVTPPGSECSIILGTGVTAAAPGSLRGLHLIVTDIEKAIAELSERGIAVDGPFRDATGVFHRAGTESRVPVAHPERRSYGSFAAFTDPDGNGWFVQEVTRRAPGR
ncbi:VOC family protein [Nocardia otitidiscaviarum]|uniref:VOC family protein n=1 Tax=Nocardia otitidiscaviarum TaxID=1823 RepID=UPI0004A75FAD|nr:VOC family protein [Nocardia otitidiscaviarum]MBF6132096.1 VOC family protein [Nocardia otitidiscaviarum]MBF6483226.1 VOC family protein [Nocardia otitidiscaviarum]